MLKFIGRTAAVATAAALTGCIVYYDDHPAGVIVVDEPGHVHGVDCGHYWYDGRWYLVSGQGHGPGCGHYWDGSRWILARTIIVGHGHVCTAACAHFYTGGTWYLIPRHVHRPGCGHVLRGGIWVGVRF